MHDTVAFLVIFLFFIFKFTAWIKSRLIARELIERIAKNSIDTQPNANLVVSARFVINWIVINSVLRLTKGENMGWARFLEQIYCVLEIWPVAYAIRLLLLLVSVPFEIYWCEFWKSVLCIGSSNGSEIPWISPHLLLTFEDSL